MKKFTQEEFIEKSSKIHNNKYDYSKSHYIDSRHKVCIVCPEHGEFWQYATNHLQGHGCPVCSKGGPNINSLEWFISRATSVHNGKYTYDKVVYQGTSKKIIITCPVHGDFVQEANSHLQGHGCPLCSYSKGEELICRILNSCGIEYTRQFKIDISQSINPSGQAYIDFYIPSKNVAIEYNGKQHYTPIEHFGGKLELCRQQARDQYVQEYCKDNGINLVVFKFNDTYDYILQQLQSLCN